MATLQSYGVAEVMTGSCHLLQVHNILVDFGMFQGLRKNALVFVGYQAESTLGMQACRWGMRHSRKR